LYSVPTEITGTYSKLMAASFTTQISDGMKASEFVSTTFLLVFSFSFLSFSFFIFNEVVTVKVSGFHVT